MDRYKETFDAQKRTLKKAQARKGQKPSGKASRAQLETGFIPFATDQIANSPGHHVRTCFISYAYPPSTTALKDLESITIDELVLETHHTGKVLIVRSFAIPQRIQSVQVAVEDEHRNVDRLALYNADPGLTAKQLLPSGEIFAAKEPFYKGTADGGYIIRVDHPSDLLHLHPDHALAPAGLLPRLVELDRTAADYKKEGNAAYAKKDYNSALNLYTCGLEDCDEPKLRCDFLRNRAMVNLCLKKPEQALADAKASLLPSEAGADARTDELNGKAAYRAGRAAYDTSDFAEAKRQFELMQIYVPHDKDVVRELERTAERVREQSNGAYDIDRMSKSTSKKHNRLDHATFTANVEVRDAGNRGRGLFASKDLKAGDLVLCEKGFSVAFDSEETCLNVVLNINTERARAGTQATLLFSVVKKLLHSPSAAASFYDLCDGGYTPSCAGTVVDGLVAVDTFQAQAILEHNAFGCPTIRSTAKDAETQANSSPGQGSSGVWLVASYTNHSCIGNAARSFMGDMMIVRATKDIAAGNEIFMPYRLPSADHEVGQKELHEGWGFRCDCELCVAEESGNVQDRKQRLELVREAYRLMESNKPSARSQLNKNVVARAEKLFSKLEQAYDVPAFNNVPKIGLADLGEWLCQAGTAAGDPEKIIEDALATLRHTGYDIIVEGDKVQIDYAHCHLERSAIDAAVCAAQAYGARVDTAVGAQFEEFAKKLYRTLYGELRGFKERYGT